MNIFRLAAILAAVPCLMATTDAVAQMHGGHMAGGMHSGGAHFSGQAHGFHSGGVRHDGRFFHGPRFASSFVVGGIWYPWYAYSAPVYANGGYYYYCPSAAAYYPNVTVCPEPWVLVSP